MFLRYPGSTWIVQQMASTSDDTGARVQVMPQGARLSGAASTCSVKPEKVSLCDAGSQDAFQYHQFEVPKPAAVPAAHLSVPLLSFGHGFSLPCCLSSLLLPTCRAFQKVADGHKCHTDCLFACTVHRPPRL